MRPKYRVAHIDPRSLRPAVYEYEFVYDTWRDLVDDLALRAKYANAVFYGRGSHVFCGRGSHVLCGDEPIGHTDDFTRCGCPINRVTLKQFLALDRE